MAEQGGRERVLLYIVEGTTRVGPKYGGLFWDSFVIRKRFTRESQMCRKIESRTSSIVTSYDCGC